MTLHSIHPVFIQNYALTFSLMSYIRKKCRQKLHFKLIQACKEFLVKTPILNVKVITFKENGVYISDEIDEVAIDLDNLSIKLKTQEVSFDKNSPNWSLFRLNKNYVYSCQNMIFPELEEMAKKKTCNSVLLINYNFSDSDGNPILIEEIFTLFSYARKFVL